MQCICVRSAFVFAVALLLTRPVALGCQFRRVDDAVDGSLGDGVLLLQQLDGLPQLVELRVLWQEGGGATTG